MSRLESLDRWGVTFRVSRHVLTRDAMLPPDGGKGTLQHRKSCAISRLDSVGRVEPIESPADAQPLVLGHACEFIRLVLLPSQSQPHLRCKIHTFQRKAQRLEVLLCLRYQMTRKCGSVGCTYDFRKIFFLSKMRKELSR